MISSRILGLAIAALLIGATIEAKATTIYGSAYIVGGGAATLYNIDPTSGAATSIGAIGFNQVGGIDFNPVTGVLYGTGQRADGTRVLITINPTTGAGVEIGPLGGSVTHNIADISFRSDGGLYATDGFNRVYRINTSTGAATLLGSGTVTDGNALAFSLTDTLYKVDRSASYTVDQTTGAEAFLSLMHYPGADDRANAMDFDATGTLWASVVNGPGKGDRSYYLDTIDVTTGSVTVIGATVLGLDAIAVLPGGPARVPDSGSTFVLLGLSAGFLLVGARFVRLV